MNAPDEAGPDTGPAFVAPPAPYVMPPGVPEGAQIWLVRHGQTEWSRTGRHTGTTDVPLTAKGEAEARALAPCFAALRPALVLCSPRSRARRTAELAGLHVDAVDPDLAEWDYGEYEGLTSEQIHETDPGWTIFAAGGAPGGEHEPQIRARTARVLDRAAAASPSGPVVLVAHGHISRVLGARWIGLPVAAGANLLLDEAAPCVLSAQKQVPVFEHWNRPNPLSEGNPT